VLSWHLWQLLHVLHVIYKALGKGKRVVIAQNLKIVLQRVANYDPAIPQKLMDPRYDLFKRRRI
jgi:hypothetical protein